MVDATSKFSAPTSFDKSHRVEGSPMLVIAVALLVIAVPLISVSVEDENTRSYFVLIALAAGAIIGVAALIALAAGWLSWGAKRDRFDVTRSMAEQLPDGAVVTDRDGKVLFANAAYLALSGNRNGGLDVRPVERLFTGTAEVSEALYRLTVASREGRFAEAEVRLVPPLSGSGEAGWYRIRTAPIHDQKRSLWIVTETTKDHQQHENIYENLQRLYHDLDHAPVGYFSSAADGSISYLNATLAGWLGQDLAETAPGAIKIADIVVGDASALIDTVAGRPGEVRTETIDLDLKRRNGQLMAARLLHSVAFASDGSRGAMRTVVLDRSGPQQATIATDAAEARFARYFNNTPMAIATVDPAGIIGRSNPLFARVYGALLPTNADGKRQITTLVVEADRAALSDAIAAALQGQADIPPFEAQLVDGGKSARLFVTPVSANEDKDIAIVYLLDTTEQKKLEDQFAQSQKMNAVGNLAGGIAHDFNNLLQAILGSTELQLNAHKTTDPAYDDLIQIRENARRAAELVKQLLAFSRRQTLNPKVLSLGEVLSDFQNTMMRVIGSNIETDVHHGRDLWPVRADQSQLVSAILNLCVNARDAMPDGGKITIRSRNLPKDENRAFTLEGFVPGDYVQIEVEDTGTGMSPDVMARIFEPFFTTKDVGKGTGLGLAMVYGFVKQSGGFIYVDSTLGKGTVFRILLPRHRVEADPVAVGQIATEEKPKPQPAVDVTGEGTILIVEDEESVRAFMRRALGARGYQVREAMSGVEALELVRDEGLKVDLIVSDVMMPEMDGPTMYKEMQAFNPDCRIIFVSGYAEEAFRNTVAEGHSFRFLPKPFSLKQLVETVKAAINDEPIAS